jgi:hypothetical protein
MTTEKAWRSACILNRLPDTPQMREAFYHSARHAMSRMIDADEDQALTLNDELRDFGHATLAMPR